MGRRRERERERERALSQGLHAVVDEAVPPSLCWASVSLKTPSQQHLTFTTMAQCTPSSATTRCLTPIVMNSPLTHTVIDIVD